MLGEKRNHARWFEYSVSVSLMIVLIAMITGVTDFGALLAIASVNAVMIFFGLLQGRFTRPGSDHMEWLPYVYGCIAGSIPWIVIVIQIATSESKGFGPPTFVYGIIISLFILFNTFSVKMVLQYQGVGRWRDYLLGEKTYIAIRLIAISLLAWLGFTNILLG